MRLQGRNLRVNMKGNDVRALQQALRQLDFDIDADELAERRFGSSTSRAVREFQKKYQLEATREVNEDTASLIRDLLAAKTIDRRWLIRGIVLFPPSMRQFGGVRVEAFADAELKQPIGRGVSNERGQFSVAPNKEYRARARQLGQLWFRWTFRDISNRTPQLDPWSPGRALRLPLYERQPSKRENEQRSTLQGRITTPSGLPASSFTVWLVEQTVRHCQYLASAETDRNGSYQLVYDRSRLLKRDRPDLQYFVFAADGVLLKQSRTPDVTVPDESLDTTWIRDDSVREAFRLIRDRDGTAPVRPEDIDYLIRQESISGRAAELLRGAASLAKTSSIDIPIALAVEAAGPDAQITDLVEEGVRAGLVDRALLPDVDKLDAIVLEQRDRDLRRGGTADVPLQDVLKSRLPDETSRLEVTKIWLDSHRDPEKFMLRIKEHPELSEKAEVIRFTVEVAEHVGRNLELTQALERTFDAGKVPNAEALAAWDTSQWKGLIETEEIAIPDRFQSDEDESDAAGEFAALLRNTFEHIYPGRAIREHFQHHASSYQWGEAVRSLLEELEKEEIDPSTPVTKLEREHPELFEQDGAKLARQGLATFQRLHRVAGNIHPIQALADAGLHSARAISQTDPEGFAERFAPAFDGNKANAMMAHKRAARITALAKLTYSELSERYNSAPVAVLNSPQLSDVQADTLSTWRDLFGSEDLGFCDCPHCKSVFGPAAYLFDMLLFLDRFDASDEVVPKSPPVRRATALTYLNCFQEQEQIVKWVQDNPAFLIGSDRTRGVPPDVAERILQKRRRLGGKFISLRQVYDVDGVGPDTLHDIIYTSWGEAGPVAVSLALHFLNSATAEEITERIKDDPDYISGSEQAIGVSPEIAEAIVAKRNTEDIRGRFDSLSQVETVPGVGADTLHDIIYTFYEPARQYVDIPWIPLGSSPTKFVALTTANAKLAAVDSGGHLWFRQLWPPEASWERAGFSFDMHDVVAIAGSGRTLFAATDGGSGSDLLRIENLYEPEALRIGEAPKVIAMTERYGELFAVTSNNKLLKRAASTSEEPWKRIGSAPNIIALAAGDFTLCGVTDDNKLLMRESHSENVPWIHIGPAHNVVTLTLMYGALVGLTEEGEIWMFGAPPRLGGAGYKIEHRTLLDNFRPRRPDVPALELNCNNTNIEVPQIDLANELLADLVGTSICFGVDQHSTSFKKRSTTGTSEERRAWPEYEPQQPVLDELATATYPWTLPYDYKQDRAHQARAALSVDGDEVVETLWEFERLSGADGTDSLESVAWALARHALNLLGAEVALIANLATDVKSSWGDEVAGMLASGEQPTIAALKRAGRFDFAALEDALETQFVRQATAADAIRIRPIETCDTEQLRLEAPLADVPAILDRLHRFERLRRKVGWSANQLDNALAAQDLELDEDALLVVGLLLHLQNRLELDPDTILALFHDPPFERPFTLRPEKRVLSAFERLFGTEPVDLPTLEGEDANEANAADNVVATLAQRVGAGHDEVRFIVSQGYVAFDGTSFADPLAILKEEESNLLAAWRAAVAGVFRAITFASALDLPLSDFTALIDLSGKWPLLHPRAEVEMRELLINAVSFVGLSHQAETWPMPAAEVLYLTTSDADARRLHAPDTVQAGVLFRNLLYEIQRVSGAAGGAGGDAGMPVRDALTELLGEAETASAGGSSALQLAIERSHRLLEWSSVLPDLKERIIASLPAGTIIGGEVPVLEADERVEAGETWEQALTILPSLFLTHLERTVDTSSLDKRRREYRNAIETLERETRVTILEPSAAGVGRLADTLRPLLTLIGVPGEKLASLSQEIASTTLSASIQAVSHYRRKKEDKDEWYDMERVRERAAQRWLPALAAAARRRKVDAAAIALLADAYALDERDARLLLTQILQDPDDDQSLLRAFVARDGSTERLNASLVETSYANEEGAQFSASRVEPSLQLDWTAVPPPVGIDPEAFEATLKTSVATSTLKTRSEVRRLVVESTGSVTLTLRSGTDESVVEEQVLEIDRDGTLQREAWDPAKAHAFFDASGLRTEVEVEIAATFSNGLDSTVDTGTTEHLPSLLRVFVEAEDGELAPLRTGTLTNALARYDKAARVVRALSLPAATWPLLMALPEERRLDLNGLPIGSGRAFDLWQKALTLESLWQRNDEDDMVALQAITAGTPISVELLARVLELTPTELQGILRLFDVSLEADQMEVSPPSDWPVLDAALRLSDLGRKAGLPLAAMLGWMTVPSDEFYRWALGALRALRPEEEWFKVLQHIHDPVREHLRDALVAWLVTHSRIGEKGVEYAPFTTPEAISDYLFTDVQMSACMLSSRVQFGYAAVQKYIDAIRLGFEPGPEAVKAQERFEREWSWRRFYRLWEANRRVFVYPENWLDPDLRPDKTPFFQELEEELLEGPLTTASAENALVNYLGKLVDVARPEIVGIVHEDEIPDSASPLGFRDPELQGTHVFARSRSQPHTLYYRRRLPAADHRWTPWEKISTELPGTHYVPFIAFRRLYLICAEFGLGRSRPEPCNCNEENGSNNGNDPRASAHVALSIIERRHGHWSQVRRGKPIEFDASGVPFDDAVSNDSWDDFPESQFEDVEIQSEELAKVRIDLRTKEDGMDRGSELKVVLLTSGGPRDLGNLYNNPIKNWPADFEDHKTFEIKPAILPSEVTGIRLEWEGVPPQNMYEGDDCVIDKIKYRFYTSYPESTYHNETLWYWETDQLPFEFKSPADEAPHWGYPTGTEFTWRFSLPAERSGTIHWDDPDILPYFKVENLEWDPPPSEVYSLHVYAPPEKSTSPIAIHLTSQEGVSVCSKLRRRFRFTGHDQFPDVKVASKPWPPEDEWVHGKEYCMRQVSQFRYLRYLELFPDGTINAPLPSFSYPPFTGENQRGAYHGTLPWRQFFRAARQSKKRFFIDGHPVVWVEQPYQVCVPSKSLTSGIREPLVLDEISVKNEGYTFFIEYGFEDPKSGSSTFVRGDVPKWFFHTFSHPQAVAFLRLLQANGIPRFLAHETQTTTNRGLTDFEQNYDPKPIVSSEYPVAEIDFSINGAYADYNWELFFHAPLLIAQRLSEAGRYEDADRWFRLLFDPTKGRLNQKPVESFQTKPLREAVDERLEEMLYLLDNQQIRSRFEEQVDRLNRFPYQPHLIARTRLSAYQKTLVMKYLDHLIAWGDELFRRAYATDNRTELENAASRYDFAAKLLGRRPEILPAQATRSDFSYDELSANKEALDLWDPVVEMENQIAWSALALSPPPVLYTEPAWIQEFLPVDVPNDGEGIPELLYFCIPHNRELLGYWDTLADRLAKLRTCRDIEGIERVLSLYGRQIDPGLLVRATAMGLDIDVVLGYLSAPTPRFRFNVLLQRARSACDRAHSFGQALLGAIEKRESEELARLRSKHELALLRASKRVRDEQVDEARESLEALSKSRESAEARRQYYATRQRLSVQEAAEGEALERAAQSEHVAAAASAAAADRAFIPNFPVSVEGWFQAPPWQGGVRGSQGVNYDFGGRLFSNIEQQKASKATYEAGHYRAEAGRLARQGQYDRRWDDWQLQKELAEKDIEQIDRQIASAEIRLRIAEIEQENQLQQIDQSATIDAYLRDKFTNAKLYRWMESRLSRLYYQQYRLAYDLAMKAQRALRYELGLEDESLLPDTWDPSRRGMEAASDLQHELEKLETQYLDAWRREHEKTKVFSLADRWPLAFLELRQTGRCIISIRESDLDEDEPGDYFRRIKQVSMDIPCVHGPHVPVNARLTLLRSETRINPHMGGEYYRAQGPEGVNDDHFRDDAGAAEHIVTSTGVNDTGQFDSNLGGEKLLPFEGAGVISTWRIELPLETNRFPRSSISDVVLRFLYTARDGGDLARSTALESRQDNLEKQGRSVMLPLATYFGNAWRKFTNQESEPRELELELRLKHLPYALQEWAVAETTLYFEVEEDGDLKTDYGTASPSLELPGIRRLALESPIEVGKSFPLNVEGDVPKKGWLLLLLKPG